VGLAGLACLFPLLLPAADKKAKKPNSKIETQNVAPHDKSVEFLAELARPSVVVIFHFGRDGKEDGVGAGFIVSSNGLIATSLHVIGEARPIAVRLSDGKSYEVTEIHAWDRKLDLAVIRVDADGLPALKLGNSDALKQGAPVVAMGNPLGLEHSIVQGVVSARREFDGLEMIQLAIPIEPGNSGGPLLDLQGRVHGILNMKSAVTPNLGFAVPINALKPLLEKPNPIPMKRWLTIGALNSREWTPLFGARWSQKAGRIQAEGVGQGFGGRSLCLSQRSPPELPYELAVTVRLDDESGAAGLVFGSDGDQKHYGFYPTAGQLRLTRFDGPTVYSWSILQQTNSAHYRPGEWNDLKVRREKDKFLCYVNGQCVFESTDHALPDGKVGLAKFRDTKAAFKNFQVGKQLSISNAAPAEELIASITKQIEEWSGPPDAKLAAALQPYAPLSQSILAERAAKLEAEATQLRKLSFNIHRQSVQAELLLALDQAEDKIDLFHAGLLISKLDNPDLDLGAYRRQLDDMAREMRSQLPTQADAATKLAALTNYLFTENGFHGSRADYYNRANSYLNEVLDDREGLPITLSILFLELAQRIGLEGVAGLPLPGHFLVRYRPKEGEDRIIDVFDGGKAVTRSQAHEPVPKKTGDRLIDVFNGGKTITRSEAQELVIAATGEGFRDSDYKSASKREIIIRMLRNLLNVAQRSGVTTDSLRYLDVIVALAPESALDRLARASLRLQTGDVPGAKADFKWLLDTQPPGLDVERIAELFQSL
jgi:regulator of sirC expression with transglutaminase-like and TPR domain